MPSNKYNLRVKIDANPSNFTPSARSSIIPPVTTSSENIFSRSSMTLRTPPSGTLEIPIENVPENNRFSAANVDLWTLTHTSNSSNIVEFAEMTTSPPVFPSGSVITTMSPSTTATTTVYSTTTAQSIAQYAPRISSIQAPEIVPPNNPIGGQSRDHYSSLSQQSPVISNITLHDVLHSPLNPVQPKFQTPSFFDPACHNVISFLNHFEQSSWSNGWDDKFKMYYFGSFLINAAKVWYNSYKMNPQNSNKTWQTIKNDFIQEFGGDNPAQDIKLRLKMRKQGPAEDIKNYYYELICISSELGHHLDTERFVEYFEEGLHPQYLQMYTLLKKPNQSMSDLKQIVHKISETQRATMFSLMGLNMAQITESVSRDVEKTKPPAQPVQYRQNSEQNNTTTQRSHDGRPKCFKCNRFGHIARACRERIPENRNYSNNNNFNNERYNNSYSRRNDQSEDSRERDNYRGSNQRYEDRNQSYSNRNENSPNDTRRQN